MFLSTEGDALPWEIRIKIAIGTAQALSFLHSIKNSPLNQELRMHNIMLDEQYNAKLFYLASNKQWLKPYLEDGFTFVGKSKYLPPEMFLKSGPFGMEADVYTFGVILLDLLSNLHVRSRSLLHLNYKIDKMIEEINDPRLGRDYPVSAATQMCTLLKRCTMEDKKKRPLMQEVLDVLNDIAEIKD
ncbi:unnamed protein product [Microthlaspi erraticum]|uniref:Protein kinase domain-containing protein n=1 Tax=Microthlaspi erraticum TaxID=1685480 RepID=A0A6D2JUK7_9BRAS|nr:unnamed protein product [Microthlaspi erraticum]